MKALVLSGGSGTNLRPFSYSGPKQLFPVANKPILRYVLDNIVRLGISEVGVVAGRWRPEIADVIGDGSELNARITYIEQAAPLGLADCIIQAQTFLGDDDFVMHLGDNILPDGIGDVAREFQRWRPAAQLAVQKVADPQNFGVADVDEDGAVVGLTEKPRTPMGNFAVIGVYCFTAAIHEAVHAIVPSPRGELEVTDAIQWMLARGSRVRAIEYMSYWRDAGRIDDLLECNRYLLGRLVSSIDGDIDESSEVTGPVIVEPGAQIRRSRVQGPAAVGAGTLIKDSYIGPGSSVGRDCVLNEANIAGSIILDAATVSHASRLRDSVIGRRAIVSGGEVGAALPWHRLVMGDDSRLELAPTGRCGDARREGAGNA